MTDLKLPGRLGDPEMTFGDDPRADSRIAEAMALMELAPGLENLPLDAGYEDCLNYCMAFEQAAQLGDPLMWDAMPDFSDLETSTEVIQGVDGNDITLHISYPKNRTGPLPGIVHTHGGGMVLMTAEDPASVRWRHSLAQKGMVVVGIEFRNGGGRLGPHPFPAGLNDCASGAKWTIANKENLGISSIVISGESGGGNLCIATTLKALKEGWVAGIDGVYAMCPYIAGSYAQQPADLLSLHENNTYMLDCAQMASLVTVYDPTGESAKDALAWPLQANIDELKGLPPHVISVNQLDPLRDEGLKFYGKLVRAGVSATARTVNGTPHAGDMSFADIAPEITAETLRSIHGFASSLG